MQLCNQPSYPCTRRAPPKRPLSAANVRLRRPHPAVARQGLEGGSLANPLGSARHEDGRWKTGPIAEERPPAGFSDSLQAAGCTQLATGQIVRASAGGAITGIGRERSQTPAAAAGAAVGGPSKRGAHVQTSGLTDLVVTGCVAIGSRLGSDAQGRGVATMTALASTTPRTTGSWQPRLQRCSQRTYLQTELRRTGH